MDMNQLLESIYASNASDSSLEKTAEQAFLGAIDIKPETPVAENPFSSMSLDELVKLADDLTSEDPGEEDSEESSDSEPEAEASDTAEEAEASAEEPEEAEKEASDNETDAEVEEEDLNKTAAAMFGGQLMAHAVVHELGLIKEAVANGHCRVCKENPMDVDGVSICSTCAGGDNVNAE
jgi:hypothetical protein